MKKQNKNLENNGLQFRVRETLPFWAKARANKQVLDWISNGVPIPFSTQPKQFHHHNPAWTSEETEYWQTTFLPKLLKEGAIK